MKIPFDSLTLMAVSQELRRALAGGRIQRVTQPRPLELYLTVRRAGSNYTLALSADAAFARAHLTHVKQPNPPEPPAFCMICRKHLEGGVITSIEQLDFDRILELRVDAAGRESTLVVELMGKHSNIILVSESGMVLDAIKRISRKLSRVREVWPGIPYVSPPPQAGALSPFEASDSDLHGLGAGGDSEAAAARLMARFQGISPFLADEIAARAAKTSFSEAWREIFGAASAGEWMPVVIRGSDHRPVGAYPFPTVQVDAADQNARDSIDMALDHYYGAAIPRAALDSAIHALSTEIDRGLKARLKKADSLRRSLAEAGRAEEHKQSGELLLANLRAVDEGMDSVTVADFYAPGEPKRVIALDPTLSASENAEAYFRRYRKAKDSAAAQSEFLEAVEADIVRLSEAAETARAAASAEDIREIRRGLLESGALRESASRETIEKKASRFQGKKIRAVTTPEGWELLYGENSEANDYLTARVASPNDLWLHVRASPSSHVVIRTRNEPGKVPQSVIKRAALIAAQHSASKHSATVPVDYTLKKYVRRPRGGAPGTVLYQNEKTIHVSPKAGDSV